MTTAGHPAPGEVAHSQRERVRDPVCGMMVDPKASPHHTAHAGKTYHFCGGGCRDRFLAEPARYLTAPTAADPPKSGASGQWTCPMHPEIVRNAPGGCPICGMALEPLAPTADAAANPELRDMTR